MKREKSPHWLARAMVFVWFLVLSSAAWAETDVTAMVRLNKGLLMYDRLTKQSYLDVSVTNISTEVLLTPVKVVIDSISTTTVTVANADGVTDDGKPFLLFTTATGQLLSGATIAAKRLSFSNPVAARFTYTTKVLAELPDAAEDVGVSGGSVTTIDPANPAMGITVEFPAGALTAPSTVTIDTTSPPPSPPSSPTFGPTFDLRPSGQFSQPVTIKVSYDEAQLAQNNIVDESSLRLYTFDAASGLWLALEGAVVDTEHNVVIGQTNHFSHFCLIANTLFRHGDKRSSHYAPVLFVHGINLGVGLLGLNKNAFVGDSYSTFGSAVRGLYDLDNGPNVYTLNYDTSIDITLTAATLADAVKKIKADTGAAHVNVIAHSMGGLVARAYIQGMARKLLLPGVFNSLLDEAATRQTSHERACLSIINML
ncbi:MAG: hypothetical protein BM485_14460 [Desulfobulbaceae bacterium DB1]|nr:MAG: hypothetical protein BM485_14460 [Desulfobulbaceae bacterium DB1]